MNSMTSFQLFWETFEKHGGGFNIARSMISFLLGEGWKPKKNMISFGCRPSRVTEF